MPESSVEERAARVLLLFFNNLEREKAMKIEINAMQLEMFIAALKEFEPNSDFYDEQRATADRLLRICEKYVGESSAELHLIDEGEGEVDEPSFVARALEQYITRHAQALADKKIEPFPENALLDAVHLIVELNIPFHARYPYNKHGVYGLCL